MAKSKKLEAASNLLVSTGDEIIAVAERMKCYRIAQGKLDHIDAKIFGERLQALAEDLISESEIMEECIEVEA